MTDDVAKIVTWTCPTCDNTYEGRTRSVRSTRRAHERRHEQGLPITPQLQPGWKPSPTWRPDRELVIPAAPKASRRRR